MKLLENAIHLSRLTVSDARKHVICDTVATNGREGLTTLLENAIHLPCLKVSEARTHVICDTFATNGREGPARQ